MEVRWPKVSTDFLGDGSGVSKSGFGGWLCSEETPRKKVSAMVFSSDSNIIASAAVLGENGSTRPPPRKSASLGPPATSIPPKTSFSLSRPPSTYPQEKNINKKEDARGGEDQDDIYSLRRWVEEKMGGEREGGLEREKARQV